jgi:hypothetical protein
MNKRNGGTETPLCSQNEEGTQWGQVADGTAGGLWAGAELMLNPGLLEREFWGVGGVWRSGRESG